MLGVATLATRGDAHPFVGGASGETTAGSCAGGSRSLTCSASHGEARRRRKRRCTARRVVGVSTEFSLGGGGFDGGDGEDGGVWGGRGGLGGLGGTRRRLRVGGALAFSGLRRQRRRRACRWRRARRRTRLLRWVGRRFRAGLALTVATGVEAVTLAVTRGRRRRRAATRRALVMAAALTRELGG